MECNTFNLKNPSPQAAFSLSHSFHIAPLRYGMLTRSLPLVSLLRSCLRQFDSQISQPAPPSELPSGGLPRRTPAPRFPSGYPRLLGALPGPHICLSLKLCAIARVFRFFPFSLFRPPISYLLGP
jgi:hypothetical protein